MREDPADIALHQRSRLLCIELDELAAVDVQQVGAPRQPSHEAHDGLAPEGSPGGHLYMHERRIEPAQQSPDPEPSVQRGADLRPAAPEPMCRDILTVEPLEEPRIEQSAHYRANAAPAVRVGSHHEHATARGRGCAARRVASPRASCGPLEHSHLYPVRTAAADDDSYTSRSVSR